MRLQMLRVCARKRGRARCVVCGITGEQRCSKEVGLISFVPSDLLAIPVYLTVPTQLRSTTMGLPAEQNAAVKTGSGHDAKAPVQRIPVSQEPGPGLN